jgi:hypothetical protein
MLMDKELSVMQSAEPKERYRLVLVMESRHTWNQRFVRLLRAILAFQPLSSEICLATTVSVPPLFQYQRYRYSFLSIGFYEYHPGVDRPCLRCI